MLVAEREDLDRKEQSWQARDKLNRNVNRRNLVLEQDIT
jgi:hypothetical protein